LKEHLLWQQVVPLQLISIVQGKLQQQPLFILYQFVMPAAHISSGQVQKAKLSSFRNWLHNLSKTP
jgi:hypothetical protein